LCWIMLRTIATKRGMNLKATPLRQFSHWR
jgi:hypothetical protein